MKGNIASYETLQAENQWLKQRVAELEAVVGKAIEHEQGHNLYRTLVETAPYGISFVGMDGKILMCNQSKAEFLRLRHPDDIIGQDIRALIAPEYLEYIDECWHRAIRDGQVRNVRYEMIRPGDQSRLFVETCSSLIVTPDGTMQGFLNISRDITEQLRHEYERDAMVSVATALRTASDRREMIPLLLDQVMMVFHTSSALLCLFEPETNEMVIALAKGQWKDTTGTRTPIGSAADFSSAFERWLTDHTPAEHRGNVCVTFFSPDQVVGALCVCSCRAATEENQRLLHAIGDMAANALHRMRLYEQTRRRLNYLDALHTIDHFINASLDLHETLRVLIDQVIIQLNVDAAAVLLFNPVTGELEYAAGSGFYTDAISHTRLRPGEGYAGRAAAEAHSICVRDVSQQPSQFRAELLEKENIRTYYGVPLIAKGSLKGVLEIFHRTIFDPDQEWLNFLDMLASQAAIAIDNAEMFAELGRTNDDLILAYDATIEGWARALELRDVETEGHSRRVTELTLKLASALGVPQEDLIHVRRGALLHDVGKMAIPDAILLKPGPLNVEESIIMQQHPNYAYDLLFPIPFLRPALDIPYAHHEKWDGTGYPRGLKGEEIPLAARIFAVVDVFDALSSDRPYRDGWEKSRVLQYIREQSGKHFDPRVVEKFLVFIEEIGNGPPLTLPGRGYRTRR